MKQYQSIQYLRGIAAMMVVYFHFLMHLARNGTGVLPDDIKVGAAGVDIFFIISGFVMWVTTCELNVQPLHFWARRVARIVPLYWSFTLLLAVLAIIAPSATRTQVDIGHLVTSLLFIPDIHPFKEGRIWPLLVPGWSLNFEMYFYLIFGSCLIVGRRGRLRILASVFVGAVLLGRLLELSSPIEVSYTSPIILEFLAGVVIAELVVRGWTVSSPVAVILGLVAVCVFIATAAYEPAGMERLYWWGLPSAVLVFAFLSVEGNGWKFGNRIMLALGDSSYSLYLSHMFTLGVIGFLWGRIGIVSGVLDIAAHLVALLLCGAVGFITWKFYEVPLQRIARRISTGQAGKTQLEARTPG